MTQQLSKNTRTPYIMSNMCDDDHHTTKKGRVVFVAVPFPAQGHANQMVQLSSRISGYYGLPVYYVGSAAQNRQTQLRYNGPPQNLANIHFHDFPNTPPSLSPPPTPTEEASLLHLRRPLAALLHKLALEFTRVVVVHDHLMSYAVQDFAEIPNAESYEFVCVSAFSSISISISAMQSSKWSDLRSGRIFNTSRLIEAPYLEFLEREQVNKSKPIWGVGPIHPRLSISSNYVRPECLNWLDKQEPKSVIYVAFGTTVSLSDEQINELAHGLERSRVKFLWVLRDADFEGEDVRRAEVPEGNYNIKFKNSIMGDLNLIRPMASGINHSTATATATSRPTRTILRGEGMVVSEWVPQMQILGHSSIGGFMSHCGWNSCNESITMGVAMAAWPMHSDQPRNADLIAYILKTGILVREWKERLEVVKASRIENVVRRLMASEEMRKTAEKLRVAVRRAPGIEFDAFIAHIHRSCSS